MEQECTRHIPFVAWDGTRGRTEHTLHEEYSYVTGVASGPSLVRRDRDVNNVGKSVADFVHQTNAFIQAQRDAGRGVSLPSQHAFLTADEVIATRLYSGPAYVLLNGCASRQSSHRAKPTQEY